MISVYLSRARTLFRSDAITLPWMQSPQPPRDGPLLRDTLHFLVTFHVNLFEAPDISFNKHLGGTCTLIIL